MQTLSVIERDVARSSGFCAVSASDGISRTPQSIHYRHLDDMSIIKVAICFGCQLASVYIAESHQRMISLAF